MFHKLKILMATAPPYLKLSPHEQRSRFVKISHNCDTHLEEAYAGTPGEWAILDALRPENHSRNRYSNVFPWDKNRVILPANPGGSDYINASWVELDPKFRYIAAQGPLVETIHHFWAMCFNEAELQNSDTVVIAMVTPLVELGREKCAKYWPTKASPTWNMEVPLRQDKINAALKVTWVSEKYAHDGDFLLTTLKLESPTVTKTVIHYYYHKWQDARVPNLVDPLIALSREMCKIRQNIPNIVPIVHCSAGVGRTGTFIAIDYLLNGPDQFGKADAVFDLVTRLRGDRMMMVQTVYQYLFLYEVSQKLYKERQAKA